ncbi:hypothetical protein PoB_007606500 [Plakobranchus ocellatus]|uniref:Transposase n=1 Tax=Plakobranchus ocellatus TaxID=259542 RepID=A0AAV4DZR0_9GAST|nr:hypothetical protein PoB_007606500 [Plakobranchus ocellatus]
MPPRLCCRVSDTVKIIIIMTDYLGYRKSATEDDRSSLLIKLQSKLVGKRRGKPRSGVHLTHDDAPAHITQLAALTGVQFGFKILPYPE